MSYTPPNYDAANFSFVGESAYTPPASTAADFSFASSQAEATLVGVGIVGVPEATGAVTPLAHLTGAGVMGQPQSQLFSFMMIFDWEGQIPYTPPAGNAIEFEFEFALPGTNAIIESQGIMGVASTQMYAKPQQDPYWDNVILRVPFDGSFADVSKYESTPTVYNATIGATNPKFGEHGVFSGTKYVVWPDVPAIGTADYTFEFWIRVNVVGNYVVAALGDSIWDANNFNGPFVVVRNTVDVLVYYSSNKAIALPALVAGVWTHIALERKEWTVYANSNGTIGTRLNIWYDFGDYAEGAAFGLPTVYAPDTLAYDIDDARLTSGVARYGGENFTPPVLSLPLEGVTPEATLLGLGMMGAPSVQEVTTPESFVQLPGILGLPRISLLTGPVMIDWTGAGIVGAPEVVGETAFQVSVSDGMGLLDEFLDLTLGFPGNEELAGMDEISGVGEYSGKVSEIYNTFAAQSIITGELKGLASQPISLQDILTAIHPLFANQNLSFTDNPIAATTALLRVATVLVQTELLRGQSEIGDRLLEAFGLHDDVSPIMGGTVSEILTTVAGVNWDVRRSLLASEQILISYLTRVGLELSGSLAAIMTLTDQLKFGVGLRQLETATLSTTGTLDVKQLLSALEGLQLQPRSSALLEIAAVLRDSITTLDKLRFGLGAKAELGLALSDASAVPITIMQAREIMAVGLSLTTALELPIHLTEALRAGSMSAPRLGLLAQEALGLVGNALAEIYFGAKAAEALALRTNPTAAAEIGRLASELVVLAETTGFGAQWALADALGATVLASPDVLNVLVGMEGFSAHVAINVLTELNASLKERWTALDKLGLLFAMRAETMATLGDTLGVDALRWAKSSERLGVTVTPVTSMELTSRLTAVAQLADLAGLRFGLSMADGLQLQSALPDLIIRVQRLSESLGVSTASAVQLELTARLLEFVIATEVAGAVNRLSAAEIVSLAAALTKSISATLSAAATIQLHDAISQQLTVIVTDSTGWSSSATNLVEALFNATDSLAFVASMPLEDGDYQAWVLNSNNLGVTSYTNMMFDKLVSHRGRTFGLTATGLYELTGDTDDGTPIDAWLRTGQIHLGTEHSKNVSRAYLYVKQEGDLYLRTIATTYGCRQEHWYKIVPNSKDGDAETTHRLRLRRTVFALSWSFEIHNVDGSNFDLRGAEILPVILRRRT